MNLQEQWQISHGHHVARRFAEAEDGYRRMLHHVPNNVQLLQMLAEVCYEQQKLDEAIGFMERACQIEPGNYDLRYTLGTLLREANQPQAAVDHYQAVLDQHPNHINTLLGLGVVYDKQTRFSKAIACYERILHADDRNLMAHYNLGLAMVKTGQVECAHRHFNRALAIDPNNLEAQTANLFILHNMPDVSGRQIYEQHRELARRVELVYSADQVTAGRAGAGRTLRVGYVSPDFRRHSVSYFIKPILEAHNRDRVTCYCYSNTDKPDDVTESIKGLADHWRNIAVLDDDRVEQMIRDDGIEILVDLSGHTDGNRLMVFARKPAPVQVTWIGYPGTTGLSVMDYRITDGRADPSEQSDADHVEKLVRMEPCFLCYQPPEEVPVSTTAPVRDIGHITFGSFNSLAKYSEPLIAMWARVLNSVPGSKLLLKPPLGADDAVVQGRVHEQFAAVGIRPERVVCMGMLNDLRDHLALYNRIDVALDTFPYNGTTTTCEALWMGVPVITLAGDRHASRVGASLLHTAGLPEYITETADEFVAVAKAVAEDVDGREELRSGLRERLRDSALLDKSRMTAQLEEEYFGMMNDVCREG